MFKRYFSFSLLSIILQRGYVDCHVLEVVELLNSEALKPRL